MAAAQQQGMKRFDGKLDGVLRRELSVATYERIVATEVCILVTSAGKRTHGHVILGGNYLYFAPIPIKTLRPLLKLSDIVSIATANDLPAFLGSKEGEKTVHIIVKYYNYKQKDQKKTKNHLQETTATSLTPPPLTTRSHSLSPMMTSHDITPRKETRSLTPTAISHTTSSPDKQYHSRLQFKDISRDSTFNVTELLEEKDSCRELISLDLFLLKEDTNFVHHFNIYLEDVQLAASCIEREDIVQETDRMSISQHFFSLKTELLSSECLEDSAKLYVELSHAVDRYFQLKMLFWQNSELLEHLIDDLDKKKETNLLDYIEYKVIITELLRKIFQDTFVCEDKWTLLTQHNGQVIEKLVNVLLNTFVNLPSLDSPELSSLLTEVSGNISSIIYELSRIVQQVTWRCVRSTISISWLCELCQHHSGCLPFLCTIVQTLCHQMSTEQSSVVSAYYNISLLLVLVTYSCHILELCRRHCQEEFQYIIIPSKLMVTNQLTLTLVNKLKHLRKLILSN